MFLTYCRSHQHDLFPDSFNKYKRQSQTEKICPPEKHCYPGCSIARRDYTEMEVPDDESMIIIFVSSILLALYQELGISYYAVVLLINT